MKITIDVPDDFYRLSPGEQQQRVARSLEGMSGPESLSQTSNGQAGQLWGNESENYIPPFSVDFDVTERNKLEQVLQESQERLQLVINSVPALIAYIGKDHRYQLVNDYYKYLFQFPPEEIEGLHMKELLGEGLYNSILPYIERVLSGKRVEYEVTVLQDNKQKHRKVNFVPHQVDGKVEGFVTLVQDVTQYKMIMKELHQAKEQADLANQAKNEIILRTAIDGFWELNIQGKILKVNEALCAILGYTEDELLNKHLTEIQANISPKEIELRLHQIAEEGGGRFKTHHRKKDGKIIDVEISTKYVKEQGIFFSFIRDITTELHLERQLRQSQKMEALGTLAGGIAHDFNNILASIMGNTEYLMLKLPNNEGKRHLEEISKAGDRAANLVRQILTFSRMDASNLKPVNLASIVMESLKMVRSILPANIAIHQDLQASSSYIIADATQIHQIILNLCTNGHHAMEELGGTLEVTLKELQQFPIALSSGEGSCVELSVRDTGHGIPPETLEKIFDPFFTTKAIDQGTGLGLSVVHGIVEKHHGKITVESKIDKGTRFLLYFPITEKRPDQKDSNPFPPQRGAGSILIVEDESAISDICSKFLESKGYTVTVCVNGDDALNLFKESPNQFDLIYTDQTMPIMTGKQLAQTILTIKPDIPIILSSGYSDVIPQEEALTMGIRKYLRKPFKLSELQQAIKECLKI